MNERKEIHNAMTYLTKHRELSFSYFSGRLLYPLYCAEETCDLIHDPDRNFTYQLKRHLNKDMISKIEKLDFSSNKYKGFRGVRSWDFENMRPKIVEEEEEDLYDDEL